MNEETKAKIRKYKKNLVITGWGFMSIEAWAIIKFIIRIIEEGGFKGLLGDGNSSFNTFMFYFLLIAFFIGTTALHLYISLSAIRYGTDKSRHLGFLVAVGLYIIFTVLEFPSLFEDCLAAYHTDDPFTAADTTLAALLVEITILFILIDMISSTILLRREEKKLS